MMMLWADECYDGMTGNRIAVKMTVYLRVICPPCVCEWLWRGFLRLLLDVLLLGYVLLGLLDVWKIRGSSPYNYLGYRAEYIDLRQR